jgi:hypothetical protein
MDVTALERQARSGGQQQQRQQRQWRDDDGAGSSTDGGAASESSLRETERRGAAATDVAALERYPRQQQNRWRRDDGGDSSSSSSDEEERLGEQERQIDAIRGNVPDMFPPPDPVRWCGGSGCTPANKPQGCAYIRVLVTYSGISRQVPMPCQPTVEQVINYAADAFQVDAIGRTFRLYTRSRPFVALPLRSRLVQLRTTSLYEFVMRPGPRTDRVCQGFAIFVLALALTAAVWWMFAIMSENAGANGRYGGPWRSAPFSWGGGAGRNGVDANGGEINSMGGEPRGRLTDADGGLPYYRGEGESSESWFSGWDF